MTLHSVAFGGSMRRVTAPALVAFVLTLQAAAAPAAERANVRSPDLVKQLTEVMAERRLSAIAARDPEAPDRYVAAMLFPGVQLLLISARSDAPAYIDAEMSAQKYGNVYAALHQGVTDSKLFVQDMGGDGLHGTADRNPDIVYERGVQRHLLDGDHKAVKMSSDAYTKHVEALDRRYARLLTLVLTAARSAAADATRK
ncbi:MAG: hypothetical protein H0W53_08975 [Acidobacteria bacterium]|nr:hypothetical protein [Acidobacteriota bacterium]